MTKSSVAFGVVVMLDIPVRPRSAVRQRDLDGIDLGKGFVGRTLHAALGDGIGQVGNSRSNSQQPSFWR